MQMKERTFMASEYRFGFNGQEQDGELMDGAVSFKYRVHDPRIGKFLSVDPLAPEYPWNSSYAFAENRVIDGIDLEGLEWENSTQAEADASCENGLSPGDVGYVHNAADGNNYIFRGIIEECSGTEDRNNGSYGMLAVGNNRTGLFEILQPNGEVYPSQANRFGLVELPVLGDTYPNGRTGNDGSYLHNGFGYKVYNREGNDQYAMPENLASFVNFGLDMYAETGTYISFGDMSRANGGSFAPDHQGHTGGTKMDWKAEGVFTFPGAFIDNPANREFIGTAITIGGRHGFTEMIMPTVLNNTYEVLGIGVCPTLLSVRQYRHGGRTYGTRILVQGISYNFNDVHNDHVHFGF
jgi:RHS repeat-associated protein